MVVIKFPFTSFQQFNLDWIMQQLKKILDFMPLNGVPGDVLQRNVDGAAWMPISAVSMDIHGLNTIPNVDPADELPIYDNDQQGNYKVSVSDLMDTAPVQSVNGQTGDVVLSIPLVPVDSVNGQTGTVVLDASDVGALPNSYVPPVTSVNGQTGDVVITAAVDSVNGQTGTVVLDASDVGALPDTYVAPVTSVNGQTGDVIVGSAASLIFGSDVTISITAPSNINMVTYNLHAQKTADGKALRIYGTIRTYGAASAGWKEFIVSGISITAPSNTVTLNNVGLWLDENEKVGRDDPSYVRILVNTSGTIKIGLYYRYASQESNLYNFIIFPFIVTLP